MATGQAEILRAAKLITCGNSLCQKCLQVDVWNRHAGFESWGPDLFTQEQLWVLNTCRIVGLLPLMIFLITASLSSKM